MFFVFFLKSWTIFTWLKSIHSSESEQKDQQQQQKTIQKKERGWPTGEKWTEQNKKRTTHKMSHSLAVGQQGWGTAEGDREKTLMKGAEKTGQRKGHPQLPSHFAT